MIRQIFVNFSAKVWMQTQHSGKFTPVNLNWPGDALSEKMALRHDFAICANNRNIIFQKFDYMCLRASIMLTIN